MMAAAEKVAIMVWKATISMFMFFIHSGQLRGSCGKEEGRGSSSRVPCRCTMYALSSSLMYEPHVWVACSLWVCIISLPSGQGV
jgi:hypothetical protein